jgi:hypothetical protein
VGFSPQRLLQPSREVAFAILFAAARTVFCAYRAATQSLTGDEAFSYNNFIGGPWNRIYPFFYDANNHVLYSILAKLSVHAFRTSEFTIRLPSVLAGFFLVLGIYYVLAETVSSRAVRWIALITLSLHPLLLDFSVAARGYGLSLTLLVWAIWAFLRGRDLGAGILLGLSMSANLTILYPAAGLALCPFLLRRGDTEKRIQGCLTILFAATLIFVAICYEALAKAATEKFYAGVTTIDSSLFNLILSSIRGSLTSAGLFGTESASRMLQLVILPVIAIFVLVQSLAGPRGPELAPLVMLSTAIAGLAAAHGVVGLNYPVDRLGLYLILLFGLSWAIAASLTKIALARRASGVLTGLLILQLITQIHVRYFSIWRYDLGSKEVAQRLLEETRGKPPDSVKIGATWYQQPALEFYRTQYHIAALQPIKRLDPTPLHGFDFYVLDLKDDKTIRPDAVQRLRPLYSDGLAQILLAKEP